MTLVLLTLTSTKKTCKKDQQCAIKKTGLSSTEDIECSGYRSCEGNPINSTIETVYCSGAQSCQQNIIKSNEVQCQGWQSCHSSHLHGINHIKKNQKI